MRQIKFGGHWSAFLTRGLKKEMERNVLLLMTMALSSPLPLTVVTISVGNLLSSSRRTMPSFSAFSANFSSSITFSRHAHTLQNEGIQKFHQLYCNKFATNRAECRRVGRSASNILRQFLFLYNLHVIGSQNEERRR